MSSADSETSNSSESIEIPVGFLPRFFSFMIGVAAAARDVNSPAGEERRSRVRVLRMGRTMVIIGDSGEGEEGLEAFLREVSGKSGPLPASKASIEAMPTIAFTAEDGDCPICLDAYVEGGEGREMPCKHRFHSGCIEKWLGLHGSCPVCRFGMPLEEGEEHKISGDGGSGGDGGEEWTVREIHFRVAVSEGGATGMDADSGSDSGDGQANGSWGSDLD